MKLNGARLTVEWDLFLKQLVALRNYRDPKSPVTRSDILRACLERGAPILANEYLAKYGRKVELKRKQKGR
jgi:hypothetical protein